MSASVCSSRFNLSDSFLSSDVRFSNVFRPLVPVSGCNLFLIPAPCCVVSQAGLSGGMEALREAEVPEFTAVLAAVSRAVSRPLSVDTLADRLEEVDPLLTSSSLGGLSTTVYFGPWFVSWVGEGLLFDVCTDSRFVSFFDTPVTLELSPPAACSLWRDLRIRVDGRSSSDELFLPRLVWAKFLSVRVCQPPVDVGMLVLSALVDRFLPLNIPCSPPNKEKEVDRLRDIVA